MKIIAPYDKYPQMREMSAELSKAATESIDRLAALAEEEAKRSHQKHKEIWDRVVTLAKGLHLIPEDYAPNSGTSHLTLDDDLGALTLVPNGPNPSEALLRLLGGMQRPGGGCEHGSPTHRILPFGIDPNTRH